MRSFEALTVWLHRCGLGCALTMGIGGALAGSVHAQANAPWVAKANMNMERIGHASVVLDGKVVVIGGVGMGQALAAVEKYDPAADRWTAMPPLPEPRVDHGAAVCSDTGEIVVAGGFADAAATQLAAKAFAFSPAMNTWREIAEPPVRRGSPGMAASNEGRVFLVGGAPALRTVDAYDCDENRWTTMPSMITGRQKPGVAFIEGELFVAGGRTSSDPRTPNATLNVVEALNFRNQWDTRAPMLTARSGFAFTPLVDEFGAAVGGTDGRAPLTAVEIYTTDSDSWARAAPLPTASRDGAGVSIDTMVFFTGGGPVEPALPSARLQNFRALLDPALRGEAFSALRGADDD